MSGNFTPDTIYFLPHDEALTKCELLLHSLPFMFLIVHFAVGAKVVSAAMIQYEYDRMSKKPINDEKTDQQIHTLTGQHYISALR